MTSDPTDPPLPEDEPTDPPVCADHEAPATLPVVEEEHLPLLESMEGLLGYRFRQRAILLKALTHPSLRDVTQASYERLEFLGDAVLGLVVAEHLFRRFRSADEGQLTRLKSTVVSRHTLARLGRRLRICDHVLIGKGLQKQGTVPRSVTANATEALLGAIYLDGGLEVARDFILEHLADRIGETLSPRHVRNHKSRLQHLTQRHGLGVPTYEVHSVRGPDHERLFEVCALVGSRRFEPAEGPSKKIAEQRAARIAYKILEAELDEPGSPADP